MGTIRQLWHKPLAYVGSVRQRLNELELQLALRDYVHRKSKGLPAIASSNNLSVVIFWTGVVLLGCVFWYLLRSRG